jgi:hypothetical protein
VHLHLIKRCEGFVVQLFVLKERRCAAAEIADDNDPDQATIVVR